MTRVVLFSFALGAYAPLQCSRSPEPDLRTYETPPDALDGLAHRFKAEGDTRAYRETLRYLVERYPSSRFAVSAKDELAHGGDAGVVTRAE